MAWNPSNKLFLLAIVIENKVIFLNPETYLMDKLVVQQTNAVFREEPDQGDYIREFCLVNLVVVKGGASSRRCLWVFC